MPLPECQKLHDSDQAIISLRDFQLLFKISERNRKKSYQLETQAQKYDFSINEHTRQARFKEQLRRCQQSCFDQKNFWDLSFVAKQRNNAQEFLNQERLRVEESWRLDRLDKRLLMRTRRKGPRSFILLNQLCN